MVKFGGDPTCQRDKMEGQDGVKMEEYYIRPRISLDGNIGQ